MALSLEADFPNLHSLAEKKTSDADECYNCIAWAFGDNQKWWWPSRFSFWPLPFQNQPLLQAFEELFAAKGWEETNDYSVENGFTKVALYVREGEPTHAARLLPSGYWTSKLGKFIDISHELHDLDGPAYGVIHKVYRKAN